MMVLIGAALGTISVTLHSLRRVDDRLRVELDQERAWKQFVDRWRDDVHRAGSAEIAGVEPGGAPGGLLRLTVPPSQAIDYALRPDGIVRTVRGSAGPLHHESFAVRVAAGMQWRIDGQASRQSVVMELGSQTAGEFHVPPRAVLLSSAAAPIRTPKRQ
jgi:hypothetical protein